MFDIGFPKSGHRDCGVDRDRPRKADKVARTPDTFSGDAALRERRQADITREMELEELRKLQSSVEDAARSIQSSVDKEVSDAKAELNQVAEAANPVPDYPEAQPPPAPALPDTAQSGSQQQLDLALDSSAQPPAKKQMGRRDGERDVESGRLTRKRETLFYHPHFPITL